MIIDHGLLWYTMAINQLVNHGNNLAFLTNGTIANLKTLSVHTKGVTIQANTKQFEEFSNLYQNWMIFSACRTYSRFGITLTVVSSLLP